MTAATRSAQLRPGVALGAYPERPPATPGFLERLGQRIARRAWSNRGALGRASLSDFVTLVERAEADLWDVQALRQALAREGLTDDLVAMSFALLRQAAADALNLRHYPAQLKAGRVMLAGALAEMHTGEGKTLAATLPAGTAALAGIPVHVVTANDYLVTRDAAARGPVYRTVGLSIGAITESSTPQMRREAYARDITYVTSKQLAFDYLRDRLARGERQGATRTRLDSLRGDAPAAGQLLMRGLCFAIVDEADSVLIDEARTPFVIAQERDAGELVQRCKAALALAGEFVEDRHYIVEAQRRRVQLSEEGADFAVAAHCELPAGRRRRVAIAEQALAARLLFHRDRDYLVRDDKVQIIDPLSGRVMGDRSWSRGLQQMVEIKEGCPATAPRDTLARMTFQRFFRRYLRLCGMTGTAREVAAELGATYGLQVVAIETHRPCRRERQPIRVSASADARWAAVVERVAAVHRSGRPILIGTRSVEDSERLSERLAAADLAHEVLNARQDANEARIVAGAGRVGQITVATNMAGRGTDIALAEGVAQLGGLHVMAIELNDAARLDRQLAGRCARQGEPGAVEVFLSADDELIKRTIPRRLRGWLAASSGSAMGAVMLINFCRLAQRQCERRHRNERRNLATMQDRIDKLLSFSGSPE